MDISPHRVKKDTQKVTVRNSSDHVTCSGIDHVTCVRDHVTYTDHVTGTL